MVNTINKKISIRSLRKSKSKAGPMTVNIPLNKFNQKNVSKKQEDFKLNNLDYEDDKILKEFQQMEIRLRGIKKINKVEEIKNSGPNGIIEKSLIKSNPEKKLRKDFKGCAVQSRITVYENIDENAKQNEYFEVKKIYRKCPKTK
jgi:hypothetical protein